MPLLLAPLLPGLATAQTAPPELVALMARMASVTERRARFREERRISALSWPLLSSGTLHYRRPHYVAKQTEEPQRERFEVDGAQVALVTEAEGRRVFALDQVPELQLLVAAIRAPLAGDLATLEAGFALTFSGQLADWHLQLVPRDPRALRFLSRMDLRGAGTEVLESHSLQANGDVLAMQITPL